MKERGRNFFASGLTVVFLFMVIMSLGIFNERKDFLFAPGQFNEYYENPGHYDLNPRNPGNYTGYVRYGYPFEDSGFVVHSSYYFPGVPCSETDGGLDLYHRGELFGGYIHDYCKNENTLVEWTCGEGHAVIADRIGEKAGDSFVKLEKSCDCVDGICATQENKIYCFSGNCKGWEFPIDEIEHDLHMDGTLSFLKNDKYQMFVPFIQSKVCVFQNFNIGMNGQVLSLSSPKCYVIHKDHQDWWTDKYAGVYDVVSIGGNLFGAIHGETFNWYDPYPSCVPNKIGYPRQECDDTSYSWSYFGTPSFVKFSFDDWQDTFDGEEVYKLYRPEVQLGPGLDPSTKLYEGYDRISNGIRSPTFLLKDDYLYTYFLEREIGKDAKVQVARSQIIGNELVGFEKYSYGWWKKGTCTNDFCKDLTGEQWAGILTATHDILPSQKDLSSLPSDTFSYAIDPTFKVVYVKDKDIYLSLEDSYRVDKSGRHHRGIAYRTSETGIGGWSLPIILIEKECGYNKCSRYPFYGTPVNLELTSTQEINSDGFYVFYSDAWQDNPHRKIMHVKVSLE